MEIEIENFGPVKKFKFDTKCPMHLIVGSNNIGKSYALTAYYFAISALIDSRFSLMNVYSQIQVLDFDLGFDETLENSFLSELEADKKQDIDVTDFVASATCTLFDSTIAQVFNEKIESTYTGFTSILNQLDPSLPCKINIKLPGFSFSLVNEGLGFKTRNLILKNKIISTYKRDIKKKSIKLQLYERKSEDIQENLKYLRIVTLAQAFASIMVPTTEITDISYLPASRSGLYQALSSFGAIIAELSKKRSFLTTKIELPGISVQLSEYYLKLTEINQKKYSCDPESFYEKISDKIENDILQGKIQLEAETKKLFYTPRGTELRLELSATSSMVSELGPVVAYIRYILSATPDIDKRIEKYIAAAKIKHSAPRHILIIEEPEAHLHPENQIKMTNIYAELANFGVTVVMTSHSNYVFNKLSNIIISKKLDPKNVRCDLFEYSVEGTTGKQLEISEFGIDDLNFVDASEQLLNEKMDLINDMEFTDD